MTHTKQIFFDPAEVREAGERVYNVDIYEARNNDETPETLAEAIITNPVGIINFLCDIIDDLQA